MQEIQEMEAVKEIEDNLRKIDKERSFHGGEKEEIMWKQWDQVKWISNIKSFLQRQGNK